MKKQIILSLLAFSVSIVVAFGQAPNLSAALESCPTPKVITATCVATAGPLNPVAGTQYTYTVNVPTPIGDKSFHWFVTTDLNFIATGNLTNNREAGDGSGPHIAASGTNYNVPTTATAPTDNSVQITWKAFTHSPTAPVLLVIQVTDEADCTNNNLEAYLIRPVHAFTLDIENLASDGKNASPLHETCVSAIQTATYVITNATTGEGEIQFNFGTNYMFFVVSAANFSHSYMPRFQVNGTGLTGTRVISAVDWAYPADAVSGTWNTTTGAGGAAGDIFTSNTPVTAQSTTGSVGATGECIVVRITIQNNRVETIADEQISLAVDANMYDPVDADYANNLLADIHHADGPAGECPWYDDFTNDVAIQVLTPRPDINQPTPAPTPATPFVPTDKQ